VILSEPSRGGATGQMRAAFIFNVVITFAVALSPSCDAAETDSFARQIILSTGQDFLALKEKFYSIDINFLQNRDAKTACVGRMEYKTEEVSPYLEWQSTEIFFYLQKWKPFAIEKCSLFEWIKREHCLI
jgi:hypothetical protein